MPTSSHRRLVRASVALACGVALTAAVLPGAASAATGTPEAERPTVTGRVGSGPAAASPAVTGRVGTKTFSRLGTVHPAAGTVTAISYADDRLLVRSSRGWASVALTTAYKRTVTRSLKTGAILTARSRAVNGGAVLLWYAPGRGKAEIRVNGVRKALVSTAYTKARALWVGFKGAGIVTVKVYAQGLRGVYVDALRLNPPPPLPTSRGGIVRVNASASGAGGNVSAGSEVWSPDGAKVAFRSRATNLVPGVTDGYSHVYLKSLATGAIRLVDEAQDGTNSNDNDSNLGDDNSGLAFRPDGTELLFCSAATNLGPGDNGLSLYSKSLTDGSVGWIGYGCARPAWSPDGRVIAWESDRALASSPQSPDDNGDDDIYAVSTAPYTGYAYRVSTDSFDNQVAAGGPMGSHEPVFSPDSLKIAFTSYSHTLVPGDTNVTVDVFVKDLASGAATRVSTGAGGKQALGESLNPAWSPDGTRIAFDSLANNLVATDGNVWRDVFVKTLSTGAVSLVSTRPNGTTSYYNHFRPSWSPDSTRIAFDSEAFDLVAGDHNAKYDVFVKYLSGGYVQLVSSSAAGLEGNATSKITGWGRSAWSKDGRRIVFASGSTNLVAGDGNGTNTDIFVKTV